jgi:hypothetical protein
VQAQLRAFSIGLALLTSLAGCDKPSAHVKVDVFGDGVYLLLMLDGVDEVEILGQRAGDGETIVVPFDQLEVGMNEIAITGKGLEGVVTHVDLPPSRLLDVTCSDKRKQASIELLDGEGKPTSPMKTVWYGCELVGGKLVAPLKLADGFTLEVEGGELIGDALHVDLRPALWAAPLPKGVAVRLGKLEHGLVLKSKSGKAWTGKLVIDSQADPLASVLAGLPDAGQGMPEAGTLAAMRVGDRWSFEGSATTLGQIDLWVHPIEKAEPVAMKNCSFQDLGLGSAVTTLKVNAVTETFVAVDRQGKELGRKAFEPTTCPTNVTIEPGQTELTVVTSEAPVRQWVQGLRGQ